MDIFIKEELHKDLTHTHDLPLRFYSAPFVNEYGRLEVLRSQRYNKEFSIIRIEMDRLGGRHTRRSRQELLKFIKVVVKTIMKHTREPDIIGMIDRKSFISILPETDYFGALIIVRRLRKALRELYSPDDGVIFLLAATSYPYDGKAFEELVENASLRIEDYRNSLFFTLGLEDKPFWDSVYSLFEEDRNRVDESGILLEDAKKRGEWNSLSEVSALFVNRLQDVVLKEIVRTPREKGILYLSFSKDQTSERDAGLMGGIDRIREVKTKIYILGTGMGWDGLPNISHISIEDERFERSPFMLFFRRDFAYGFFCMKIGNRMKGYHTMDPFLVEGLIAKLQRQYSLQEQL